MSGPDGAPADPFEGIAVGDLFVVLPVTDFRAAVDWYRRLLGGDPTFVAHDTEVVWALAEHRWLAVAQDNARAGRTHVTFFVDDLDALVALAARRGLGPAHEETYEGGVRKITYRDPDGNELGIGGAPA